MRETGVSSAELMQRAAGEVFSVIEALYGTEKTVYFACGRGGNGGDGYGCAARYAQAGGIAVAVETGAPMRQDSRLMRENALEAGVTITDDWRILPRPESVGGRAFRRRAEPRPRGGGRGADRAHERR